MSPVKSGFSVKILEEGKVESETAKWLLPLYLYQFLQKIQWKTDKNNNIAIFRNSERVMITYVNNRVHSIHKGSQYILHDLKQGKL